MPLAQSEEFGQQSEYKAQTMIFQRMVVAHLGIEFVGHSYSIAGKETAEVFSSMPVQPRRRRWLRVKRLMRAAETRMHASGVPCSPFYQWLFILDAGSHDTK